MNSMFNLQLHIKIENSYSLCWSIFIEFDTQVEDTYMSIRTQGHGQVTYVFICVSFVTARFISI